MKAELGNGTWNKDYQPSGITAPDKVYVGIQDLGSGYATSISITPEEGYAEYIRKDALVEWARENFETCKIIGTRAMQKAFEELIDRIKSL